MSILDKILCHKQQEVADAVARMPLSEYRARCRDLEPTRGFAAALSSRSETGTAIIAEVKKGSPSRGIIRADFDPVRIAGDYRDGGATCLSVLTDREFFYGDLAYLQRVRDQVSLPLLRKDFMIDRYQLFEARAAGADAVLLIAAALESAQLEDFAAEAAELGLDVLLEVHDAAEIEKSFQVAAPLFGINNRNLKTFATDLATTERLLPLLPPEALPVAESGLHTRADIERLQRAGARAFLIGESLMRETDIPAKLAELQGGSHV
ncbi:indole-3-glycerol phosphate synthase TrpC [Geothermobacter hydrogeniphilus]|uniref:Indole-3-glycerol phosphate synthase n=1 Tax=Geothermobacter hydrogeniphilus TaxID=1969733 RepID=A0A2K2HE66_9BACT|nr:indole-3-glycerol phosphate synthase TrpC [Geothermobacter hydrogeniphilus]PNU21587.1 indole-3-glycerol phosphate synthase TrpC [Geothermobacter hydrogeniphilus]